MQQTRCPAPCTTSTMAKKELRFCVLKIAAHYCFLNCNLVCVVASFSRCSFRNHCQERFKVMRSSSRRTGNEDDWLRNGERTIVPHAWLFTLNVCVVLCLECFGWYLVSHLCNSPILWQRINRKKAAIYAETHHLASPHPSCKCSGSFSFWRAECFCVIEPRDQQRASKRLCVAAAVAKLR